MAFPLGLEEDLDVMPNDRAEYGESDRPAAVGVLEDPLPDRLGRIALEQVFGLVVLQTPRLTNPRLGGEPCGLRFKLSEVGERIAPPLVEG
jgi:hypothetical protein